MENENKINLTRIIQDSPQSDSGKECRDIVLQLQSIGLDDAEIREVILYYWKDIHPLILRAEACK